MPALLHLVDADDQSLLLDRNLQKEKAVALIQMAVRGWSARRNVLRLRRNAQRIEKAAHFHALQIQRYERGRQARCRQNHSFPTMTKQLSTPFQGVQSSDSDDDSASLNKALGFAVRRRDSVIGQ